jgi:4-hydroxy-tetrahydrodipicolinate reductase
MILKKRVAFFGICGKMGSSMSQSLSREDDIEIVSGLDIRDVGTESGFGFKVTDKYEEVKKSSPDLIIDLTGPDSVYGNVNWALDNSIDIIVGASGLSKGQLIEIEKKADGSPSKVLVVPNFAIGAVIMIKISSMISKYFDGCEIIEMHHEQKKDAPSGTAVSTASSIAQIKDFGQGEFRKSEKEVLEGSRGAFYEGINIHSIRLPGLLAHQEVIFGTTGQTLKIRHDSLDRTCFYPGLLMAVRKIDGLGSFTCGLDCIIDI